MDITFIGGPLDGEVHEVDLEDSESRVIYWPPGAREHPTDVNAPGLEGVFEYLRRAGGSDKADYVGGLPPHQ